MNEVIIVIIVVSVLIVVLSFLLYYIVKKTSLIMKNNFLNKVEKLDLLIEDKEQKVDDLNKTIAEKQKEIEEIIKEYDKNNKNGFSGNRKSDEIVLPKYADFDDGNVLENYKVIKKQFDFDPEKIVRIFLSKINESDEINYRTMNTIRSYFTYDIIYRISSFNSHEQKLIVLELLNDEEKKLLKNEFTKSKFDIKNMIHNLDKLIIKKSPEIRVLVGNESLNFDHLDRRIKTVYDEKITEGIKIIYKGIIYDYSI